MKFGALATKISARGHLAHSTLKYRSLVTDWSTQTRYERHDSFRENRGGKVQRGRCGPSPSSKSQMAAGDPLAQFRPVSLHPPASLHPAASCVTSPATLDHPRLQATPSAAAGAPTLAEALPHPFSEEGRRSGGKTAVPPFQTPSHFLRTYFPSRSPLYSPLSRYFHS